jgi:DNA-binding NtrC family response regulator
VKPTLWLIEDDPVWAELVQARLGNKYAIRHFPSADEATKAIQTEKLPKIILLDYHLGAQQTGLTVLKALNKSESPDKPPYVIMLSAQEDVQTAADTFTYGAYDYVVKGDRVWDRLKIALRNIEQAEKLASEVFELRIRLRRAQILVGGIVALAMIISLAVYVQLCPEQRLWKWDPLGVGQKPPCASSSLAP